MKFRTTGRYTQKDYAAAAHESERKYNEGSADRWYNNYKPSPLFPWVVTFTMGLAIVTGIGSYIHYTLNSMAPTFEEFQVTVIRKENDETIPTRIVYARKDNGEEITLRNKNDPLVSKVNEIPLDEKLFVGRRGCATIAHRKAYPEDIYGNILDIK